MIIVSRGLTDEENEYYKQKLSFKVAWDVVAYDAVAVIINAHSKDSVFKLDQLKSYLKGTDTTKQVALDGKDATSTVRFLKDSLLKNGKFGKNVMAATNSKELIDYVAANINAIGFVGTSWVGDEDDTAQQRYKNVIRLALVECKTCDAGFFAKPSQATISAGEYPLFRPLYYVLKENTNGLGTGFVTFLSLEQGQLIFRRSYLVPAKMDFTVRKSMMETNKNLLNKTTE